MIFFEERMTLSIFVEWFWSWFGLVFVGSWMHFFVGGDFGFICLDEEHVISILRIEWENDELSINKSK